MQSPGRDLSLTFVLIIHLIFRTGAQFDTLDNYSTYRTSNNGQSTGYVQSEMGIAHTNLWIAGHLVRSFTDPFREILIFNYLIATRNNICVSKRKILIITNPEIFMIKINWDQRKSLDNREIRIIEVRL